MPRCAPGVPGCARDARGMWVHTITGNTLGQKTFVALNNHCHAPTCLSMSIYACSKGTPLAACDARVGRLVCRTAPVYGGTGDPSLAGTRFDEPGYLYIPDCLWGGGQYGLEAPVDLEGVPLHIVKRANATLGHYGEPEEANLSPPPSTLGRALVHAHLGRRPCTTVPALLSHRRDGGRAVMGLLTLSTAHTGPTWAW